MANDSNEGWIIQSESFPNHQNNKIKPIKKKQLKHLLDQYKLLPIIYFFSDLRTNGLGSKYLNVALMIIIFLIKPEKLYKYSRRKYLPCESMKDDYNTNILDIYKPKVESSFETEKCNRNLYARGYNGPITNSKESILINYQVTDKNRHCTFTTADSSWFDYYSKQNVEAVFIRCIFINDKGNCRELDHPIDSKTSKTITLYLNTNNENELVAFGSGIISILAFYLISDKLMVYGWNYYQPKKLSSLSILEFIFSIFFYSRDYKSKDCVEYSLTHLFFAFYFDRVENLFVEGNLDYFKNIRLNKFVTKRIQSIYLKDVK